MRDATALSRDESWVRFNERVLQEAQNPNVPLIERIRFLAIYSSNFDEFFRVRVSRLRKYKLLKKADRRDLIKKPNQQLKEIISEVKRLQEEFEDTFFKDIVPELKNNGIDLLLPDEIDENQREFILDYFQEHVEPYIEILSVSNNQKDFPFLENHQLYFALYFANGDLRICNLPTDELPRFIQVPTTETQYALIFLDDIIRIGLHEKYENNHLLGCYVIKVSRDADLEIEDEFEGDLVEKIKEELEKRQLGAPTRLLYDKSIPQSTLKRIRKSLALKRNDLIPGGRYHNFTDLFAFPNLTDDPSLEYETMPPLPHPFLEGRPSIMKVIEKKNILLSFPYQKFDYIPQLILEAANNPEITEIKITLYRISKKSTVATNLLTALEKGKQVTVFIEVKARFDENNNLHWGAKLEAAGANVIYSYPGIKVHTKIMLIKSKSEKKRQNIAYIGTGNFNEKTAKIYCDHGLLTTDEKRVSDIEKVFQLLEGKIIIPKVKKLLVSPFNTRDTFEDLIDREIENKKNKKHAHIVLKMNSLEDPELIDKLYQASQAGVKVDLIVRGFCCLVPGVEGMSENIRVVSIIDRFLEHARVYQFHNDGEEIIYTGSADWMIRNLDKRVEVLTPVEDKDIKKILKDVIEIQLADNSKARIVDAGQNNDFVSQNGVKRVRAQYDIYNYFKIISVTKA